MSIKFGPFDASAIIPETRQLICAIEPLSPQFHGNVRIGQVIACGECPLEPKIPAGSRVMFSEDAGRRFTLDDQPHVMLRRGEVLAVLKEPTKQP